VKRKIDKLSLVIFDMDGLMFDTERLVIEGWTKIGKDYNINITEEIILQSIGLDIKGTEVVFKEHLGDNFPFMKMREHRENYSGSFIEENGVPVKEGLYELLDYLDEIGIPKAVATSTVRQKVDKLFGLTNLHNRFDAIVCGDEITKGKPNPDIFLTVANKLKVNPKDCIVLEDSINGIKAAHNAGMYPIMIPDLVKPSPELEKLLFMKFNSLNDFKKYLEYDLFY